MINTPFNDPTPFVLLPQKPETRWQKLLRSISAFLSGHRVIQHSAESVTQVGSSSQCKSDAGINPSFRRGVSIGDNLCEGQANNGATEYSGLYKQIGANGLNMQGVGNYQSGASELNRFSALGHRSFLLFVDENGEAYAMDGSKWSRKS